MIENLESFIKSKKESQVSIDETWGQMPLSQSAMAMLDSAVAIARICLTRRNCDNCRLFDCSVNECNQGLFD